jgi:hypothetical protein
LVGNVVGFKRGIRIMGCVVKMGCGVEGVYIGRGSIFGNPFRIGPDGSRSEVIKKYREWFLEKVGSDPAFRRSVWELENQNLICFCAPLPCHGDVLKWWLELGEEGVGEE